MRRSMLGYYPKIYPWAPLLLALLIGAHLLGTGLVGDWHPSWRHALFGAFGVLVGLLMSLWELIPYRIYGDRFVEFVLRQPYVWYGPWPLALLALYVVDPQSLDMAGIFLVGMALGFVAMTRLWQAYCRRIWDIYKEQADAA